MVFAIRIGFSKLAWHSPVRSRNSFPHKTKLHAYLDQNLRDYLS
jgi:hypothetical protein